MKEILLTQGKFAIVDDENFNYLNQWKWCVLFDGKTYRAYRFQGIYMSREIMKVPDYLQVDHINHNTLDNQKNNLRVCTHSQNNWNMQILKRGKSKYKGIYFDKTRQRKKRWVASIKKNNKKVHLGRYFTEIEAAHIYDKAATELFAEFACLNFPIVKK